MSVSKSEQPCDVESLAVTKDQEKGDAIEFKDEANLHHAAERGQAATDK